MSLATSLDRVPPQNLDAEQGVLGSMLLDRDAIARVVELIRAEDFYRDAHRRIFEAMTDLFERGEPVDLITVTDRLRDKGQLDDVGGAAYVTSLLNSVPTAANVEYYARIVLQKSMLRQMISAGTQIAQMGFEANQDVEILVDQAEKLVFSIANRRLIQEFLPIREILKESFERIDRRYQDKGTVTGVPMGFTDLDQMTSGLQPGDLTIVAARPSMGKCLKYDAEIVDARTGELCTIQEVVARGRTALFTLTEGGALGQAEPSRFVDDGIKPVFRVRTSSGREVETTFTHPFLTATGWRRLEEIAVGEPIAVPGRLPVFGTIDLPAYEVKLLAYLCAETMPTSPVLATDYADAVAVGEAIRAATKPVPVPAGDAARAGDVTPEGETAPGEDVVRVQGGSVPEIVGGLLARHPELGRDGATGTIPPLVFTLTREKVGLFLSRLLACTATVETAPEVSVRCTFPSPRMAKQARHLLLRFGVAGALDGTTLAIGGAHSQALFREVGILGWERLRTWARYDQGRLLPQSDTLWDPIAAIEYSGDFQVYDLTVPGTHNFIADDVCVHNTTLSLNIAAHAAVHHQIPVAIFSLETSKEQLVQRFLCAEAEVDGSKLRTGFLADSDWPKLARAMGRLSEAPVYIDDSATISVIEMRAKARKLRAEHGLGLIVVDYLQMIHSYKRTENRTQEISEIARSLKSLAKELEIPLIAVSQLSRAVEITGTRRPMLSHLRECVTGDTVAWDADSGRRWTVGELAKTSSWPRLLSLDSSGRLVPVRPANVFEKGENEVFEVRTSTGRHLRATANHPVLTPQGWKKVSELVPGSVVAAARRLPLFGDRSPGLSLTPDRMRLLGYLIGDGSYQHHRGISFISADPLTLEDCIKVAEREFGVVSRRGEANGTPEVDFAAVYPNKEGKAYGRPHGNPLREWLRELGVEGQSSYDKRIPERVFAEADAVAIRALLRALFSTDGCLTRRNYRNGGFLWSLHYDTVSRGLAEDVRDLLLRFGVIAQISSGYMSKKATVPLYRVCIEDSRQLAAFCDRIGIEGRKQALVDQCAAELARRRAKSQIDRLPIAVTEELWARKEAYGMSWREPGFRLQTGKTLDRLRATDLAERLNAGNVLEQATDDILWDRVVEIIPRGQEVVYDLVMPGTHNFVANGIAVHNSGELEQVADLVIFIYREDYYNAETEKKNIAEIIIAKHRNGPIGTIEMFFHREHGKFANLAKNRA